MPMVEWVSSSVMPEIVPSFNMAQMAVGAICPSCTCTSAIVGYKHCCGIFTTLHKHKAHYSRHS